jgi:hypothetical protein
MESNKVEIRVGEIVIDDRPKKPAAPVLHISDHLLEQMADRYLQDKRRWAEDKTTKPVKPVKPLPVEHFHKHRLPYKVVFTQGTIQVFKSMKSPWPPYYLWLPVRVLNPTARLRKALHNLIARAPKPAPAPIGRVEWDDDKAVRNFVAEIHNREEVLKAQRKRATTLKVDIYSDPAEAVFDKDIPKDKKVAKHGRSKNK